MTRSLLQKRRQDGFTLIEALIALVLMAMIAATLSQAVLGASEALDYIDRSIAQAPVMTAQSYLR